MITAPLLGFGVDARPFTGDGNPELEAAVKALPGKTAKDKAQATLRQALRDAQTAVADASAERVAIAADLLAAIRTGKPTLASVKARGEAYSVKVQGAQDWLALLQWAGVSLTTEQNAATSHTALLEHLDGRLQNILAEARSLDLAGATTAEDAIREKVTDAWERAGELERQYRDVRSAQSTVVRVLAQDQTASAHLDTHGTVRNYAALFPRWHDAQRGVPVASYNGAHIYATPPWSTEGPQGLWRYAVAHDDVELWVPTVSDLHAAYQAALAEAVADRNAQEAQQPTLEQAERLRRMRGVHPTQRALVR